MTQSPEAKAARIEAIAFDVDGVLTRGELVYGPEGELLKIFDARDGLGFTLARDAGIRLAMISGRTGPALRRRADDLKVDLLIEGALQKADALLEFCEKIGVEPDRVCYVGDDLIDLPAMREAGLAVAVADAAPEVRAEADWVTERPGGAGAAREVIELILKAKGMWDPIVQKLARGEE